MINVIAAVAQNGAIGNKGRLLYWLPEDLKRFKALTMGHTVVMGRKTFESLPKGALPNRRNIVLSHSGRAFPGAETFGSLEDALRACEGEEVFIIGGAAVYAEAMPLADRLFLTEILDSPAEADAFFPSFSSSDWQISQTLDCPADERHAYPFRFVDYVRIK